MKAWVRVAGDSKFEDPYERGLADRFDRDFKELFKVVPKSHRRVLIRMLYTTNGLYVRESFRYYPHGFENGQL